MYLSLLAKGMKKTVQKLSIAVLTIGLICGFAAAESDSVYDAKAEELAKLILEKLDNDVIPDVPVNEWGETPTIQPALLQSFSVKENAFVLNGQSLTARRNGGVLLKDSQGAIDYLSKEGYTKYTTKEAFQINSPLRRDEAAKFLSLFAQAAGSIKDDKKDCAFRDFAEGHTDLQSNVADSCKYGIFKGRDGFFNPTKSLTNGEALAALMRILDGMKNENNTEHRAKAYREKAKTYGLTQGTVIDSMKYLDTPITRGDMARLLEAARYIPLLRKQLGGDVTYSLSVQGYTKN